MERMAKRKVRATVVGLTCSNFAYTKTISAINATHARPRNAPWEDAFTRLIVSDANVVNRKEHCAQNAGTMAGAGGPGKEIGDIQSVPGIRAGRGQNL